MKITNLIIPILGLSQINNVNNQVNTIQIEKEINMPYEILARDNYLATENLIQVPMENSGSLTTPINHGDGC
jgi:hypothetical protein